MSKIKPPSSPDNTKDRRTYAQRIEQAFPALCVARAWHWSQGEETLQDAVDWLQDWADTRGLVGFIGQDRVQAIMADAWLPWREELKGPPEVSDQYEGLSPSFAEACRKADIAHGPVPEPPPIPIVKYEGVPSAEVLQREYEQAVARAQRGEPAASTLMAAEYLLKQGDLQRLKDWMDEHSLEIQAVIVKHLENKRRPA